MIYIDQFDEFRGHMIIRKSVFILRSFLEGPSLGALSQDATNHTKDS